MPFTVANGVRLYYEVAGGGPPLVLVHGFGCGIRSWDRQVPVLAARHRVITYDVRGHGTSDAPRDPRAYSQPTSVEDLRQLLLHLGLDRPAVGGLSMGGNIALNLAIAHPQMVSALVLADTGAGSDGTAEWNAGALRFARALDAGATEAFADLACQDPLFARFVGRGQAEERFIRSCLMTHRVHGIAYTARGVLAKRPSSDSLEARLRQLDVPTLLIVGEYDEPCVAVHQFMAETIPGARHIVIPGAGHLTNLEAPEAFNEAVLAFLRG